MSTATKAALADHWLGLLDRVLRAGATGEPLSSDDGTALAKGFARAIADGLPIEAALELPPRWRIAWRIYQMRAAALDLRRDGDTGRSFARRVHRQLCLYRASHYLTDVTGPIRPAGQRWALFRLLAANSSRVPSTATLRSLVPPGQSEACSLATDPAINRPRDVNQVPTDDRLQSDLERRRGPHARSAGL